MRKFSLIKRELSLIFAVLTVGIYIAFYGHTNIVTGFVDCDNTALHSHFRCEEY